MSATVLWVLFSLAGGLAGGITSSGNAVLAQTAPAVGEPADADDDTPGPPSDVPTTLPATGPATSPATERPETEQPAAEQPATEEGLIAPPRERALPAVAPYVGGKRAVPDYDGRPSPPPTAREALIWIPRGALYPAHLVAEYVLRRPLVAVIRWGELHSVWPRVYDFFTWDQGRSGVYPLATVDFGLKQTAGLGIVWRDFIVPNNALRASAYASTQGVLGTSAQDRLSIFRDGTGAVYIGGGFVKRPDGVFYGLGSDTSTEGKTFYSFVSPYGSLGLTGSLGGLSRVFAEVGYRRFTFDRSDISATTPSIDERFGGPGQAPLPPGFGGYDLLQSRLGFVLDSREPNIDVAPSGTGVRFQPEVAYALDPRHTALRFITWGASAGGFLDVSGARHVLALELAARFTENRGSDDIPFTELPTLGGAEWMRGFLGGRLRGRSTVVATAQYRYAFWTFADAELFSSLGNAFGSHLDDFAFDRLFLNMGAALRTTFTRDTSMTVTLAFGSNRLDAADFRLMDTTRFSFGVIHGY